MKKNAQTDTANFVWTCNQAKPCPPAAVETPRFNCRYSFSPSDESWESGENSQDYLAVGVRGNVCWFVLCDGVSLSYRGDFAAKYLGSRLFEWLGGTQELSRHAFDQVLTQMVPDAAEETDRLKLPADMPALLREVLEEKRRRGAETMYLCGRIELPEAGKSEGKVWLAWQGDSRLRCWLSGRELVMDPARFLTGERWSAKRGTIGGGPHFHQQPLAGDNREYRLMVYSDGLKRLDHCETLSDIYRRIQAKLPLEDDASWLDISWIA
ncbi:hypothetical protein [Paenibacillus tuaregi]|uniref:hypothetical protein n=1 Tax=Paenibacillus tuaregi TaxID=1816681 RepID=UPI0008385734|nr:hypothetical protein [Paenibacillus tuaregi]